MGGDDGIEVNVGVGVVEGIEVNVGGVGTKVIVMTLPDCEVVMAVLLAIGLLAGELLDTNPLAEKSSACENFFCGGGGLETMSLP